MQKAKTVACAGMIILAANMTAQGEVACEREPIAMLLSPDNKWVALVREGECSNGAGVVVSTDIVQLVPREVLETIRLTRSPDQPEHENDVLVVDYYGRFEYRPVLKWLSSRELQITIPNISGVGSRKSNYHDVAIAIRFEPDDPAAREKWRQERGLPK
jgi:hypothetical protein